MCVDLSCCPLSLWYSIHCFICSVLFTQKERKTQTLTAYLLFCRRHRPKVVADYPLMGLQILFYIFKETSLSFNMLISHLISHFRSPNVKYKYIYSCSMCLTHALLNLISSLMKFTMMHLVNLSSDLLPSHIIVF